MFVDKNFPAAGLLLEVGVKTTNQLTGHVILPDYSGAEAVNITTENIQVKGITFNNAHVIELVNINPKYTIKSAAIYDPITGALIEKAFETRCGKMYFTTDVSEYIQLKLLAEFDNGEAMYMDVINDESAVLTEGGENIIDGSTRDGNEPIKEG